MEVYSRKFLQNYKRDRVFYELSKKIVQQALHASAMGEIRYVERLENYRGIEFNRALIRDVDTNIMTVIGFLKQMLPDSSVEYKTSTRLDGTPESGIVIDWS